MLQHIVIASDSAVWAEADIRKTARISRMMCVVSGRTQRKRLASQLKSQVQALKLTRSLSRKEASTLMSVFHVLLCQCFQKNGVLVKVRDLVMVSAVASQLSEETR